MEPDTRREGIHLIADKSPASTIAVKMQRDAFLSIVFSHRPNRKKI
ncbi:MAG: hypothetical protein QXL43_05130 [Methanolinea sp.]